MARGDRRQDRRHRPYPHPVSLQAVLIILAIVAFLVLPAPWGVLAIVAALMLEAAELLLWKRFLRRYRLRVGPELLIGSQATVVTELAPEGRVRVRGELWKARSSGPAGAGETVRIAAIDGLTLEVEPERQPVARGAR
jgi:membrane protein implicated in regulation of membrane protease activity